jgi:uncharacterized protein (DUF1800 family)
MRVFLSTLALSFLVLPLHAAKSAKAKKAAAPLPTLDAQERALQMLDRFTFGPRPGDLEQVEAMTPEKWFEQQLDPDSIKDGALARRLAQYPTLPLTPEQVRETYPDRNIVQQVFDKKRPMPADPMTAAVFEVQLYKLAQEKKDRLNPPPEMTPEQQEAEKAAKHKADVETATRIAAELLVLPKPQRMAALLHEPIPDQIAFANALPYDLRNTLNADFSPREREAISGMQGGVGVQYQIVSELAQAKMLRAILSQRQLQEVMTDFWFNHFNIYAPKDSDQWYTTTYERDSIRPHALGKFRDLLLATAESPAMLVYLDNYLSIGPDSLANGVNPANPKSKRGNRGLNENYGREVMELHTVGVNGGYSQADVTHLAAILTGWSVDDPGKGGGFLYDAHKHEPGTKEWFGYTIDDEGRILSVAPGKPPLPSVPQLAAAPDGMKQGVAALTLLAASPKTAHFISYLIAQRFLADDPPEPVVARMAAAYLASDGDIKTVLRTLVASPEFNQRRFFRNKVKTPVEFIASAFRTTATDPQNPNALVDVIKRMGEPLYTQLPPTGYYITADHWMNTAALIDRLNFADQLTHSRFANQKFDSSRVLAYGLLAQPVVAPQTNTLPASLTTASSPPHAVKIAETMTPPPAPLTGGTDLAVQVLEKTLIGAPVSSRSQDYIRAQLALQTPTSPADTLDLITALILGSPDFQLR